MFRNGERADGSSIERSTAGTDAGNTSRRRFLSEDVFVAIHDARLLQGEVLESVIGVSEYLEAGEHYQLEIDLFDVDGADFEDDELTEEQLLIPMPHRSTDSDRAYDFVESGGNVDGPFVENGQAVVDLGYVLVEGGGDGGDDGNGDDNDSKGDSGGNGHDENGHSGNGGSGY